MKKTYLLLTLMFAFAVCRAQIPNSGFETWTVMGSYSSPANWDNFNSMTGSMGVYTCEQGMPGSQGMYYMKLTSKTIPGLGVVPGVAVSGTMDLMTMQPATGFAFAQRPAELTGKCKHSNSQGYMDVTLTKWDAMMQMRTTVATGHFVFTGSATGWTTFNMPLSYINSMTPDSCMIFISSSGAMAVNNDYLNLDDLSFTGSATGISTVNDSRTIRVFPNPASDYINMDLSAVTSPTVSYKINDIQGKTVKSSTDMDAKTTSIEIADLPDGNYILEINAAGQLFISRFVKE